MVLEKYPQIRYCRIKRKQKAPFEKDWQNKPYTFQEIQKFLPKEQYGVLCGYGSLIIIDADTPELQRAVETKLPKTHRVRTGSGGTHNYFFCSDCDKKFILTKSGKHYGEIQSTGSQCVGAGSTHPNGKPYTKLDENPIATIVKFELLQSLQEFIPETSTQTKQDNTDFRDIIEQVLPFWNEGDRQNRALSLAGYLRKEKRIGADKVRSIITEICERTNDTELDMRLRAVIETYKKDEKDIIGFTGLQDVLKLTPVETKNPQLMTFTDFEKMDADRNFLVENFLYPGTITMIYSPPKQFKSLIAQFLCFALVNGKSFLNMETKKVPCLYLDGENSKQVLKDRYFLIYKGMNLNRKNFPFYVLKSGTLLDRKKNPNIQFIDFIKKIIVDKKIKLIVFDTLHRFCFYDENKADDINLLYTEIFRPLVEQYGVSIIFLHHSTKKGDYRGSGDFAGLVDNSFFVYRYGKTNKFRLVNELSRCGEIPTICGEFDFSEDYIKMISHSPQDEEKSTISRLKEVTDKIRETIKPGQELRRKDIISNFEINEFNFGSLKTIDRALKFLVDNEFLDKNSKGFYTLVIR